MTRQEKLAAAYNDGVHMMKAKLPEHKKLIGIHLYGPTVSQILDAIIVAHEKGHKTVIVHDAKPKEPSPSS